MLYLKECLLLLLVVSGLASSASPCCPNNDIIRPRGYCRDNSTDRINLNCENSYMLLKDIILDGNKVSTQDSPEVVIVEDPALFCTGRMYINASEPSQGLIPVAVACFEKWQTKNYKFVTSGILALVSVVFLLFTLAIYMYLPQMRDLQGVCYMSMCGSMVLGFLSLGILHLSPGFKGQICAITGFLVYFWMISIFSWMNVISINVYRTVEDASYLKKTERKQHLIYNCYAWGFAIFFLFVSLITDLVEGEHYKPGIGDNSCWFKGRTERWIFFYAPIAVLITANIILFVLSSLKLWRSTRKYEVNKLNNLKHKFLTSLKLFLVMGISWVFEIASFAHGESHVIWRIMDIFNGLQGVVIFLILVVFRRRAIRGLANENCCLFFTRPWAEKLSPDDDADDEEILADDTVAVRLN
ncbi:probable G-protein coupled receptor Mth-like 3 [Bicyclus anynana]|uniref:Probable G-protein coupled receptor Mth-like 3 n=1 Tax=Bicyclus anynana TaxID=110368 RepID=A0A6J1NBE7_BICAN|nr:probable G-protein coupled receptor Mth-like 3 [Bicyclus anynana]